jgi:hypothetical protein
MNSKYIFSGKQKITTSFVTGDYIWLAFYGVSNICSLYESSVFNPNLIYWNLNVTADEIKSIVEDASYLYLALDDTTNIGGKVTKASPAIAYFIKNIGIIEEAIDIIEDATYVYFLTPGLGSGVNTKIAKYNKTTRAFVEIIDLTTVTNAAKIDIDNSGNLWVQSDLDGTPKITKVWFSGTWQFSTTTLS